MRSSSPGLTPGPSSVTLITTSAPSWRAWTVAPASPPYLCALSSRLNSTCSSSLSSPRTKGRLGARLTRTSWPGNAFRLRSTAPCTTSAMETRSRLTLSPPASIRDMSSRLATKRASRAVSSSIEDRSSSRSDGLILSPNARSDVAAPAIEDSGVRRSCESESSSASRTFSFSCIVAALTASRASSARSSAIAVRSRIAVSARSSSAVIGSSARMRLEAADRDWPASGDQRPKLIGDPRQRAGSPARRLLFLLRPARGAKSGGIELRVGRPGGANLQLIAFRERGERCGRRMSRANARRPPTARRRGSRRRKACASNRRATA